MKPYLTTNNWWLSLSKPQFTKKISTSSTTQKAIAIVTAFSILLQSIAPTASYALTGGPQSPEFSNFESVGTTDMVNPFTGDFTYNLPVLDIPGPNGGGYALSLSYHSGLNPEEEASWVGYGWTLNPGAIIRNKQGFADDVNKGQVKYYSKMPANYTHTLGANVSASISLEDILNALTNGQLDGLEGMGMPMRTLGSVNWSAGGNLAYEYNSYKGAYVNKLAYLSQDVGTSSTQYTRDQDGQTRVSYSKANPYAFMYNIVAKGLVDKANTYCSKTYGVSKNLFHLQSNPASSVSSSRYGAYTLNNSSIPTTPAKLSHFGAYSIDVGLGVTALPIPISLGFSLMYSYSFQQNENEDTFDYYGYLYSHNAYSNEEAIMDYNLEKQEAFNMRDRYLSIPYSGADQFTVVGEGVGGTFKAYNKSVNYFRPNYVLNDPPADNIALSLQFSVGMYNGLSGLGISAGNTFEQSVGGWDNGGDAYQFTNDGHEPYYFRFMGDNGGYSDFGGNEVVSANLKTSGGGYKPSISTADLDEEVNGGETVGRSSYIAYHYNADMLKTDNDNYYKSFSGSSGINSNYVDRANKDITDQIGEYSITNKNGSQYVYALPVYSRNEEAISYSIDQDDTKADVDANNYLVYNCDTGNAERKLGQKIEDTYATSFLLTQITDADYIDRTMNGASDDDFGGWTKFKYKKLYGYNTDGDNWYHWRVPYNGLLYNRGKLSDNKDNMGSFSSGDKEVYYLDTIETATHIAIFKLGERLDSYSASDNDANSEGAQGSSKLKKLEQITLYVKDDDNTDLSDNEIVKRVYFDYDYSLMQGQPNSGGSTVDDPETATTEQLKNASGKLTLKKVWVEYGNVKKLISPYEFVYQYPSTDYPSNYKCTYVSNGVTYDLESKQDLYSSIENYGTRLDENGKEVALDENPSYAAVNADRWGCYRNDGAARSQNMQAWVSQVDSTDFDPAAWHLKQIKLPSGGEIHVQYEQDEYAWVQDRKAMAMVTISDADIKGEDDNKYYLDLKALGITSSENISTVKKYIEQVFINGTAAHDPEKIYFKFYYNLNGVTTSFENRQCGDEYIDGYVNVLSTGIDEEGLYIKIGSGSSENDDVVTSPKEACVQFYRTNRGVFYDQNCNVMEGSIAGDEENATEEIIYELLDFSYSENSNACNYLDGSYSYFRIPLPDAKKGGGVRVKRLLTYNKGLDDGTDMVYGHEYIYQTTDGTCSGVASNEPSEGREENALIGYLKKRSESTNDQVMAVGEDKSWFEGPMGENVLPSASVGYSRVLVKNIHEINTNDGISCYEYYTAKDYPFDATYTYTDSDGNTVSVEGAEASKITKIKEDPSPEYGFFSNKVTFDCWATQGFRFVINNMHGQTKKTTQYSGDYENIDNVDELTEVSSTTYNYFNPLEELPVMNSLTSYGEEPLGKETEVITESRKVSEEKHSTTLNWEIGVANCVVAAIAFAIPLPSETNDKTHLYTHVTNKVIYSPCFVKSITSYQDGVRTTVHNKYFDPNSGDAVVQEQSGQYDQREFTLGSKHQGKYINWNFPAYQNFEKMGQKANYEGRTIELGDWKLSTIAPQVASISGTSYSTLTDLLFSGDLIAAYNGNSLIGIYNVNTVSSTTAISLYATSNFSYGKTGDKISSIEILKSARTNQLSASCGNIVSYGSFEKPTYSTTYSTYLLNNVISTNAAYYSQDWAMDDNLENIYDIGSISNPYEKGEKGKWRMQSSYVYKDDITDMHASNLKIYESGIMNDVKLFDYEDVENSLDNNWLNTNTITSYSPHGNMLEEKNILDIYSVNKFGYNNNLVYLTAANAQYDDVIFESFENKKECDETSYTCFEEITTANLYTSLSDETAHSGTNSLETKMTEQGSGSTDIYRGYAFLSNINISSQLIEDGMSIKFWAKIPPNNSTTFQFRSVSNAFNDVLFEKVAQTGEWALYEAKIEDWVEKDESKLTDLSLFIDLLIDFNDDATAVMGVYIDDVRIQPLNAKVNCYVYDPATYKLLTQFDDQHFAINYQYNQEGKLIRKLRETERGIRTVAETQYNIPAERRE